MNHHIAGPRRDRKHTGAKTQRDERLQRDREIEERRQARTGRRVERAMNPPGGRS